MRARSSRALCGRGDVKRIPAPPDEGMRKVMAHGQLSVLRGARTDAVHGPLDGSGRRGALAQGVREDEEGGAGEGTGCSTPRESVRCHGSRSESRSSRVPMVRRLHDIISVIQRRNAGVEIIVVPAAVQGETAPDSLVVAINRVSRWKGADVVIIGRGGGSREDLWAFNDERVARAIAASTIPTISAVGHEVDFTIADLVALDFRAATPKCRRGSCRAGAGGDRRGRSRAARRHARRGGDARCDGTRGIRHEAVTSRDLALRSLRTVERRRARVQELAARLETLSPVGDACARIFGGAEWEGRCAAERRAHQTGHALRVGDA